MYFLTLASAFLGGLILNLMPCVFPVIAIKAVSILKYVTLSRVRALMHGLSYTAGVVISFGLFASILIFLKLQGEQVGWGFHMQNPSFILFLIYLLFWVGLDLAGYIQHSFFVNSDMSGENHHLSTSFMTGVLVTLVATPCTVPFMASAVGVALSLPALQALGVFIALGAGLASPFLCVAIYPNMLRFLPRPGNWLQIFKQSLSFLAFVSVVWLLWVLMQQVDINSVAIAMIGIVLLTFTIWIFQRLPQKQHWWVIAFKIFVILLALAPFLHISQYAYQPRIEPAYNIKSIAYEKHKLKRLSQGKHPVFVYATAAWCLTCKMNEALALDTQATQEQFASHKVTLMKADWTNYDADVTEFLQLFQREGVPLYVLFPGQGQKPLVLPQILTPNLIEEYLERIHS